MAPPGSPTWTNKCPGARWRTLPNGHIEVEGQGVPRADPGGYHGDGAVLTEVWNKYKSEISEAASATGIPARWILALIIIESRGVNHPPNSAGAGGLMGMMLAATSIGLGRQATKADVMDPATNIRAGAGFMRYNAEKFGWELPVIAASHNAGSPQCSPTTRCKSTIDGAWTFDGNTAPNSVGMVEDCTTYKGKVVSSGYAIRATKLNNSAVDLGLDDSAWSLGGMTLFSPATLVIAGSMIALYWAFQDEVEEYIVRPLFDTRK